MCELAPCIKSIQGLVSKTASFSDQFLLLFNDGEVKYQEKNKMVNIDDAFLKYFITPQSLDEAVNIAKQDNNINNFEYLQGEDTETLMYELEVYKTIIKTILDNKISPHFVRYYASSIDCSGKFYS